MKFAFLGYSLEKKWDDMSKSEQDAMVQDCLTYDNKLMEEGHFSGDGTRLQPSRTAKTLRWHKGAVIVTDGPYAETKEQLGGVGVMEASDLEHAVELISMHPGLRYGATFEIRPIDEESLMRQAASISAMHPNPPAADPQALRFASLGYTNGWTSISEDDRAALFKSCIAFDEARVKNGQWRSGIGLQSAGTAKTVRAKASQVVITDGPFAETKEYLGGIVVLAYKDLDEGVAMLSKHPALQFGLVIELRPIDQEIGQCWETMQGRDNTSAVAQTSRNG
jgi:hypothetical protein